MKSIGFSLAKMSRRRANYNFGHRRHRPITDTFARMRRVNEAFWRSILRFMFCGCFRKNVNSTEGRRSREEFRIFERDVQTDAAEPRVIAVVPHPHRPHTPGGRKRSPEMLAAVRNALTKLEEPNLIVVERPPMMESQPG